MVMSLPGVTLTGIGQEEERRRRQAQLLNITEETEYSPKELTDLGYDVSGYTDAVKFLATPDTTQEDGISWSYQTQAQLDALTGYDAYSDYTSRLQQINEEYKAPEQIKLSDVDWRSSQDMAAIGYAGSIAAGIEEGKQRAKERLKAEIAEEYGISVKDIEGYAQLEQASNAIDELYAGTDLVTITPEEAITQLQTELQESPDEFMADFVARGRTDGSETLLKTMIPDLTDEDIDKIYGYYNVISGMEESDRFSSDEATFEWVEANQEEFLNRLQDIGQTRWTQDVMDYLYPDLGTAEIAEFLRGKDRRGFFDKFAGNFMAGILDVGVSAGGVMDFIGSLGGTIGDQRFFSDRLYFSEIARESAELGSEGIGWELVRMLPLQIVLMGTGVGIGAPLGRAAAGLGGRLVGAAVPRVATGIEGALLRGALTKAGPYVSYLMEASGAAVTSRGFESIIEATSTRNQMIAQGYSKEEADRASTQVFQNNLKLLGTDVLQFAAVLRPFSNIGGKLTQRLAQRGLVRYGAKGLSIGGVALTEAGEEYYQQIIQMQAMGEDISAWAVKENLSNEEIAHVTILGAIAGGMFAGGAEILGSFNNRVINNLSQDLQDKVRPDVADKVRQGVQEVEAQTEALNTVGNLTEVQNVVDKAIKDTNEQYLQEQLASSQARIEFLRTYTGGVSPSVQAIQDVRMELGGEMFQFDELIQGYKDLISQADIIDPNNPVVKEAKYFIENITPENQIEVIRRIEELEDNLKSIASQQQIPTSTITEEGVQPDFFGGETRVMPEAKGMVTQMGMEDYMKYQEAMATKERDLSNPPEEFKESYQAQEEIYAIEETLATDPVALWRTEITVVGKTKQYQRKVGLESFISIKEQQFPEYLTLKQAKQIKPSLKLGAWSQEGTKEYNKVPREVALDELADKWGMTSDEIANRVMEIRALRSKLKELRIEIHKQMNETPIKPAKEPTALELKSPDTSLGKPKMSIGAAKELSGFFAEHILSEDSLSAYELQRALWKKTRSQRFMLFRDRMEQLIVDEKINIEKAFSKAKEETLSGKLPVVMDDFFDAMTNDLRDALFTVVYNNEQLQEYPSEMTATLTALTNALSGKPIPRKRGTGSILFPEGGSAWDRLVFVFSDQPKVLAAIEKSSNNQTSLDNVIEMVFERGAYRVKSEGADIEFHLSNDEEIRVFEKELQFEGQMGFEGLNAHKYVEHDFEAKPYDRIMDETEALKAILKEPSGAREEVTFTYEPTGDLGLQEQAEQAEMFGEKLPEREPYPVQTKAEIEAGTTELKIKLAKSPEFPGQRYEAPIDDAFKQMPMLNDNEKQIIVRILKESGMTAIDIGNFLRANKASFDFSFWRQTRTLAFGHPVNFYRANVEAFKAMLSREAAEANWQWITRDPDYELYETIRQSTKSDPLRPRHPRKGGRQYEGTEEFGYLTGNRPIPKIARKLPWIRYSQRAFETGCNTMAWLCWKNYLANARMRSESIATGKVKLKEGDAFDITQEMAGFQKMLADLIQRGNLGPFTEAAPVIGAFAFAPRATIGRALTPRHLFSTNSRVRKESWRNLGSFVGVVGSVVALGAFLDLWDYDDDPRSSDFMTIRIGNTRIDPWAGYKQFANLYARIISRSGVSSITGAEYETNFTNLMTNFFRGKASPLFSFALDILEGKTYGGNKLEIGNVKQWFDRVLPFSIMDAYEAFNENSRNGWISLLPAWVGEGVITYKGDWDDSWNKLGIPKYEDNLRYGLTEPNYDLADVWADNVADFKGVNPTELTSEKGYPEWVRFMVETDRLKSIVDNIPSGNLYQLNADPTKNDGKTFVQYYKMWNEYQKAEDKEQWVKDNPLYSDYYLGNMTQREYSTLVKYHSIKDETDKQVFLDNHPELTVGKRDDYLRSHPQENAQLAFWGKSKILTKEAYGYYEQLISMYDVPETALVEDMAPPKEVSDDYFEYQDILKDFSGGSSEALLFRLEHQEFNDWQFDTMPDNNIEVLRINVQYRDEDAIYEGFNDTTMTTTQLQNERAAYLIENPEYVKARITRQGYELGIPDQWIDGYIAYKESGYTKGTATGDMWLWNHLDFYNAVREILDWSPLDFGGQIQGLPGMRG